MSDDEYGYDSPYEDMYDLLDDADPAPELADDLAERAVHSPIWQHTHTGELKEYFSDWDEHSDDYYDDDPNLINPHQANGTTSKARKPDLQPQNKRGRKRKLSDAREKPALCEKDLEALQATLRGPVWKKKSPVLETDYKKGSNQPIALKLSDSVMRSAYNKTQGFGRGTLKRDESWANDLSLADMGLTREVSTHEPDNGVLNEDEDEEDGEDDEQNEEHEEQEEAQGEEEEVYDPDPRKNTPATKSDIPVYASARHLRKIQNGRGSTGKESTETQQPLDDMTGVETSRKRQRLATAIEQTKDQILPTPETSLASGASDGTIDADDSTDLNSGRRSKASSGMDPPTVEIHEKGPTISGHSRKRRLSPASSATAQTASSRAKRVHSRKAVK